MRGKGIRLVVAVSALAVVIGFGTTGASQARERVAHLEAHGKVVWVTERVETGEIVAIREGVVDVSARDTDPGSVPCSGQLCTSDDRVVARIDESGRLTKGSFEPHPLEGLSSLSLPGGIDLLFVDGGEPGRRAAGPPNAAGIVPTADYVQWLNVSPAFRVRAYFRTGGVQLTGA